MPALRRIFVAFLLATGVLSAATPVRAQMTMVESGFICVHLADDVAKQCEIAGGTGSPDTCLYYGSFDGLKRRCSTGDLGVVCDPALTFPAGIAFSTGGSFGSNMYVADYGLSAIYRAPGCQPMSLFASITDCGSLAFPPSGSAYGDYLYTCEAFNGPIKRVTSAGAVSDWVTLQATYLRFGPGGAWGTGLYATDFANIGNNRITKVSSAGAVTTFTSGFFVAEGFDWGFDGDMFATDPSAGIVYRVKSDGTKTQFATLAGAADVAYRKGEQALYVVSNQGGLYRVVRAGTTAVPAASPFARAATVVPNPSRGACTIRWSNASGGVVRVEVVDAAGRSVRRFASGWRPAGEQSLAWDGRDDAGAAAAPGVYFARVASGRDVQSVRVALAR